MEKKFNPNGVGQKNGNFIGLPFNNEDAKIIFFPVPWEVTVSYNAGTATGPENIREASYQLDLFDLKVKDAWQTGIFMPPSSEKWLTYNNEMRIKALAHIEMLETGKISEDDINRNENLAAINQACLQLKNWVEEETSHLLNEGKLIGLIGGEHSTPLGYLEALAKRHPDFGILQIDAHMDLRKAYEGFTYSHASIFYNALSIKQISKIIQVGIRDFCEEEINLAHSMKDRITVHFAEDLRNKQYEGSTFSRIADEIIQELPLHVYISFDIDGLQPYLCPHTGTPVPGGLEFQEALYLLEKVVLSGRKIIGFDLSEVGGNPHEFDGNIGARILYRMANLMAKSQRLVV